jgi:hypothetical protein
MATVMVETTLRANADRAWAMLRDPGAAHRAFPGVLLESKLEDGIRTVTFADGNKIQEQIVETDDERRRIAYAVINGRFSHHSASMQIVPNGPDRSRFLWVSDFLPNEFAPLVRGLMQKGADAFQQTVERAAAVAPIEASALTGECSCGAVRYRLTSAPMYVNCCHCRECQRQTGSAFVINALIEANRVQLTSGTLMQVPVPTDSGKPQIISRCPECRIAVWSNYGGQSKLCFVRVGTLDDPAALPPDVHIYIRSKLPWVTLPADRPAFEAYYNSVSLWPADSLQRRRAALAG